MAAEEKSDTAAASGDGEDALSDGNVGSSPTPNRRLSLSKEADAGRASPFLRKALKLKDVSASLTATTSAPSSPLQSEPKKKVDPFANSVIRRIPLQ